MFVAGGRLRWPNGDIVPPMRGVNMIVPGANNYRGAWWNNRDDSLTADQRAHTIGTASWHRNHVANGHTPVVRAGATTDPVTGDPINNPFTTPELLDEVVALAKTNPLGVVILNNHTDPGVDPTTRHVADACTNLSAAMAYMRKNDVTNVIPSVLNEPGRNLDYGDTAHDGDWRTCKWATWTLPIIDALRESGHAGPIMVAEASHGAGRRWDRWDAPGHEGANALLSFGRELAAYDTNLMVNVHVYSRWQAGGGPGQTAEYIAFARSLGFDAFIGECGFRADVADGEPYNGDNPGEGVGFHVEARKCFVEIVGGTSRLPGATPSTLTAPGIADAHYTVWHGRSGNYGLSDFQDGRESTHVGNLLWAAFGRT